MCVSPAFQQRQETKKSNPRTSSTPLSPSLTVLFTEFTHHFHLSKQSFKFLKVESRATVGGAATGSLSKPEHCVKYLRDMNVGILVIFIHIKHTDAEKNAKTAQRLLTFFSLRLQSESLMRF